MDRTEYNREYFRRRYHGDPSFRERRRARASEYYFTVVKPGCYEAAKARREEIAKRNASVLRLIRKGGTYASVAEVLGLTRNQVAGIVFRSKNA